MISSGFVTTGRSFISTLEQGGPSSWLVPFDVQFGDSLGDAMIEMVSAAWRALDRDALMDSAVRVIVVRSESSVVLRIETEVAP